MSEFYSYRLTYEKTGAARYIGHLDLQNLFQRVMRRSGIKARYSEGFNPHPILSFAGPLSVGMEGLGEMADVDLAEHISPEELIQRLNAAFPAGITLRRCEELPPGAKKAAALLRKAAYIITVRGEDGTPNLEAAVTDFLSGDNPIRGSVYLLSARGNVINAVIACGGSGNLKPAVLAETLCRMADCSLCGYMTEYCRQELMF